MSSAESIRPSCPGTYTFRERDYSDGDLGVRQSLSEIDIEAKSATSAIDLNHCGLEAGMRRNVTVPPAGS